MMLYHSLFAAGYQLQNLHIHFLLLVYYILFWADFCFTSSITGLFPWL